MLQKFCGLRLDHGIDQFHGLELLLKLKLHGSNTAQDRPGKSCKSSSRGKLRILQCPQNSRIHDKGQRERCILNVGVAGLNPQILIAYPHSIALQPQF